MPLIVNNRMTNKIRQNRILYMNRFYKSMKKMKKTVLYFQIYKKNNKDFYKDQKLVNYKIKIFQT